MLLYVLLNQQHFWALIFNYRPHLSTAVQGTKMRESFVYLEIPSSPLQNVFFPENLTNGHLKSPKCQLLLVLPLFIGIILPSQFNCNLLEGRDRFLTLL